MRAPTAHGCVFRHEGFSWEAPEVGRAEPCGVQYHAQCVRAGEPFSTRLANHDGLVMPWQVPVPHYVCELCMVRGQIQRELRNHINDIILLFLERMRQIDFLHNWARKTLGQYGGKLRFRMRFQSQFGVKVLAPSVLHRPARTPAIPLVWAELYYSLRQTKGEDGEYHPIRFASARPIRSAAALFYTLDMQDTYVGRMGIKGAPKKFHDVPIFLVFFRSETPKRNPT
jgi:hypothetical protein